MGDAKSITLRPIPRAVADATVKRHHYSGRAVSNTQISVGVFYRGALEGALQFGPSMDKRAVRPLVRDTPWNGFVELNRMAFSDRLPRNSESRALAIALRLLRKHAPHVQWVVSYADGVQCGDGTIYRAAGFWLTQVKRSDQIYEHPVTGERRSRMWLTANASLDGSASMRAHIKAGWRPVPGFMLRYIMPLRDDIRDRLTCPILPYSTIDDANAGMYLGERVPRACRSGAATGHHPDDDGSTPIQAL